MPIASVANLVVALRQSRLLNPGQVDEVVRDLQARFHEPKALARELLQRGWLTAFQINQLFQGSAQNLILGQYVLLERLNETALGQVFKARHQHMKHTVTLHIVRRELLTDAGAVQRFYAEVQAASQLSHPNVLHALDAGPIGPTHFFAVEHVEGLDLERWVRKSGPLPIAQACDFICQAAQGLEHAYAWGLLHHDLRPANLLVTGAAEPGLETRVKICNLGLTLFQPRRGSRPAPGPGAGDEEAAAADFLAPEFATPDGVLDVRSNLYALGGTFYYLLTAHVPFPGGTAEAKLRRHVAEEPARVEVERPDVPPRVAAVVRRLLAKRPEARFQTPGEVVAALTDETVPIAPPELVPPPAPAPALAPAEGGIRSQAPAPAGVGTLEAVREPTTQWDAILTAPVPDPVADSAKHLRQVAEQRRWRLWLGGGSLILLAGAALLVYLFLRQEKPAVPTRSQVKVQIDADKPWQDTGVDIPAGGSVTVSANGQWMKKGRKPRCSAQGLDTLDRARAVVPEAPLLCLLGRVGAEDPPFVVRGLLTFLAKDGGRLYLQANDLDLAQNTGTLTVEISGGRQATEPAGPLPPTHIQAAEATLRDLMARVASGHGDRQQLRAEVLDVGQRYVGTAQATRARGLLIDLPSPLDALEPAKLPAAARATAGGGDPGQAPAGLVAVVGDGRLAHWREANAVVFSPDGKLLVSGGEDGLVRLWDAETGDARRALAGHGAGVTCLAVSADGKELASGSGDRTVRLWETATGRLVRTLEHPQAVLAVAFGRDDQFLATGCADNTARLWDIARGTELALPSLGASTVALLGSPPGDAPLLATAALAAGRVPGVRTLSGHARWVAGVAFRPDGTLLATGSHDGTIKLWDVATGKEVRTLTGHTREVTAVAFSPDGKVLASGSTDAADNTLKLWEVDSGKHLRNLHSGFADVRCVAFSPDGKLLAGGRNGDNTIRLWNVETGQELRTLGGHVGAVNGLAFRKDSQVLASASQDGTVKLWEAATGKERFPRAGHTGQVYGVAFSPDTRLLATAGQDHTVRLWEPIAGKEVYALKQDPDAFLAVTFRPDGKGLAASTKNWIKLWDPATGKEVGGLGGHQDWVGSVAFSPNGQLLASASNDHTARLWDLATGKVVRIFQSFEREATAVAFGPDGRLLAVASWDGTVKVWEIAAAKEPRPLKHPREVQCVAIRPDGKLLAAGCHDSAMHLWSLATGKEVQVLNGHQAVVTAAAFRPDGRVLASAAHDGTVRLWDPDTGAAREVLRLGPPLGWIHRLVFSPDGRYLATANGNGTVYLLRLAPPPRQAAR
jgi:WD40 repeat protein